MNHIILIGRLTADPELRYTNSGKAVCTFTLAVDRPFTNQAGEKEADFIKIQVWNKPAENVANYLGKGRQCAVAGRLQIRSYENEKGEKRWVTEVIAERVEFLGSKQNQGGGQATQQNHGQGGGYGEFGQEIDFCDMDVPF